MFLLVVIPIMLHAVTVEVLLIVVTLVAVCFMLL